MWNHILLVRDFIGGLSYRARLVLYALASRADKNGFCRPSTKILVSDTGLSRRGVQRGIEEAEGLGAIIRFGGQYAGCTNRYQFSLQVGQQLVNNSAPKKQRVRQVDTPSTPKKCVGECQVGTGGVPSRHGGSAYLAHEEEREVTKEVSQLVSAKIGCAKLTHHVDNSGGVRVYGWKPTTPADRRAAIAICYELGASHDEAESFARYNGSRNWSAVNGTCSVADLARLWVEQWAKRSESAYEYEKQRRREQALVRT